MIYFVSGKIGGGKTYFAVAKLLEELGRTDRPVVTNLPLRLDGIAAYLAKTHPDVPREWYLPGGRFDLFSRVRIIPDADVTQFWRYRGQLAGEWVTLPSPSGPHDATDFATSPGPVCYFLDEIHIQFPSREWQKTGKACMWYASQHRKRGDDIWLISQFPDQVDKQLRSLSQDWTYVRNWAKEGLLGIWKFPRKMTWKNFPMMIPPGARADVPYQASGSYRVDPEGPGACYDTSAGTGMAGGGSADQGQAKSGLPLWTMGVPLLALLVVLWFIPNAIARFATSGRPNVLQNLQLPTGEGTNAPAQAPTVPPPMAPQVPPGMPTNLPSAPAGVPRPAPPLDPDPSPKIVGWVKVGNSVSAIAADGTTITPRDGLEAVDQHTVRVNGRTVAISRTAAPK